MNSHSVVSSVGIETLTCSDTAIGRLGDSKLDESKLGVAPWTKGVLGVKLGDGAIDEAAAVESKKRRQSTR